ncbi:MAG TPA: hypothetical protein VGD56_14940 [Gemmatirosa sp.]
MSSPSPPSASSTTAAELDPGEVRTPAASTRHALRALARRWRLLAEEIATHAMLLDEITAAHAPLPPHRVSMVRSASARTQRSGC